MESCDTASTASTVPRPPSSTPRKGLPASRNRYAEESTPLAHDHAFLGLPSGQKNHDEDHGLTELWFRGRGGHLARHGVRDHDTPFIHLRPTVSTGRLRPGMSQQRHQALRPALTSPNLREAATLYRHVSGQSRVSADSAISTSTMRRQDARDMFDEFGIDLPEGWLSEDDDVAFAGDGTKTNGNADDATVIVPSYEGHPETSQTRRQVTSNTTPTTPSSRPRTETNPKTSSDSAHIAVKNNPFVIADQRTKGNIAQPEMTGTAARARKPTRLSDCVPNQQGPSVRRRDVGPGHGLAQPAESPQTYHTSHHASTAQGPGTHAGPMAKSTAQGDPFVDAETEEPHCQSMNSLDKKIDQLYHHAEDMYHAQHIMEHLAAGSAAIEPRRSVSARPARRLSYSPASSRETSSISPSALRPAPHSISTDALARVNTVKKTHTMGKDPLSRIREQERPHGHSLSADGKEGKKPGPSSPVVKKTPIVEEQQRHSVLWNHVPLRQLTKTDTLASKAAEPASAPSFRHHQLRKVTYPEAADLQTKRAAASVGMAKPDCTTCSFTGAATAATASESDGKETPTRQNDPDELFLPYRPTAGSGTKTLTVAEVEQVLASTSILPVASPPSARQEEMEVYSPIPIMPPNHSCS
ncbi:Putative beta-glucosidase M [Verticillium dahliae VDG1]|nr:Putative beta-glucosidase M [Verticillium dahliae VDG1]